MALARPCALKVRSGRASERTRGATVVAISDLLLPGAFLFQERPEVADDLHRLKALLGELDVVLVLDRRDQLDQVERVRGKVALEALVQLHLLGLDAEDLRRQLLQLLEVQLVTHLTHSPSWDPDAGSPASRCVRRSRRSSRSRTGRPPSGPCWARSRGRTRDPGSRG